MRDRSSLPFALEILLVTMPPHVQTPMIDFYRGECDPVEHIQKHEVSLFGRTNDDNQFTLLFTATLRCAASHWFFRLPKALVRSWGKVKESFIVEYMGGR